MLSDFFPLLVQATVQAVGPGDVTPGPVVPAFEGNVVGPPSALTLWIDDAQALVLVWGF